MTDLKLTTLEITPADEQKLAEIGIPVIKPAYTLPQGGYKASDHLPAHIPLQAVIDNAIALIGNPAMNQIAFLEFVTGYESNGSNAVREMLANFRAKDAGAVGERVADLFHETDKFEGKMPKLDEKFIQRYQSRVAQASEILENTKWLWKQVLKVIRRYEDMLTLTEKERAYHLSQFDLSKESAVRDAVISSDEDKRETELIVLVSTMEQMAILLAEAFEKGMLPGKEEKMSEDDANRLSKVGILLNARILSLRPMIEDANISARRFAMQSNSNALTALKQWDFATTGITAWQKNIAAQLDSLQNMAMNMALYEIVEFTDEQARATADSFDEQMQSMADMLDLQMSSVETMKHVTGKFKSGLETLGKAITQQADIGEKSAQAMAEDMAALEESEKELARLTKRAMKKAAAEGETAV